ncbi:MAG: VanZ family protein [Anaerolineae bacterium]
MRGIVLYWAPLLFWLAAIWWLSDQASLPHPNRQAGIADDWVDYPAHAFAYALLALLFWRVLCLHQARLPLWIASAPERSAVVLAALYGALDEWHQSFVVGRCSTWTDWLADFIGALFAVAALAFWQRIRQRLQDRKASIPEPR